MIANKSITVRDIAKEAGVSVATVSRVLNNSDRVTSKTREKVQKVIDKYDFKPNALARSLYKKRTKIIACILPDITNHYFAKMFLELERNAHIHGYTMFLCNSMNDSKLESMYINKLIEQQVDGLILMGGRVNDINPLEKEVEEVKAVSAILPVLVINGNIDIEDVHIINTDEVFAVDEMVKYLVDKGHKSIAMIGGYEDITVTNVKMKAFERVCKKYKVKNSAHFAKCGGFNPRDGYSIMNELYKNDKVPEAIIAINDEVAVGVIHACMDLGIKVPDELSLFGYDNIDLAENSYPGLTTYSHPYEEIGSLAIETIIKLLDDESSKNRQVLKGYMIERESVGNR